MTSVYLCVIYKYPPLIVRVYQVPKGNQNEETARRAKLYTYVSDSIYYGSTMRSTIRRHIRGYREWRRVGRSNRLGGGAERHTTSRRERDKGP